MALDSIEQETREQNAKIKQDAKLLEQLVAHPGWKVYRELIETVGQNFLVQLMMPLDNALESTKTEYAKGTLNGLQSAVDLPSRKIAESKSLRNPSNEGE